MEKLHQNLPGGGTKELKSNTMTPTSQICMAMIFLSCFMKYIKWAKELKIQVFRDMAPCLLVNSYQCSRESCCPSSGSKSPRKEFLDSTLTYQ